MACHLGGGCRYAPTLFPPMTVWRKMLCLPPTRSGPRLTSPDQATTGSLMLRSEDPGKFVEAPRVATNVEITVNGQWPGRPSPTFHEPKRPMSGGRLRLPAG